MNPDPLLRTLHADVKISSRLGTNKDEPDHQFWRRIHIRTFFAFIEGAIWLHKQYLLKLHEHGHYQFSTGDLALLREVQFDFRAERVREQTKYLAFADNFRLMFHAIKQVTGTDYSLDVGSKDWQMFKKAIEIRNRITHPKKDSDLLITDQENLEVARVGVWMLSHILVVNVRFYEWMTANGIPIEDLNLSADPATTDKG